MMLWMGLIGAVAGWLASGFGEFGFLLGGLLGLAAGFVFQRAIRDAVRQETATLRDELHAALIAGADIATVAVAPPSPVAIAEPLPPAPVAAAPPIVDDTIDQPSAEPAPMPGISPWEVPTPPTTKPSVRALPAEPNIVERGFAAARAWLFGGNTIVRVGLVILFVGLSFLASYAASAGLFPIELRLALIALVGIGLLGVGFRTRIDRPGFGLALQGAGVATIYMTLFAAARLYGTVPTTAAFALMIVVCALGCALALLQQSQALAVTAFAGGFAVPLLLGDANGSATGLFGYYTILNLAILFIARTRAWRALNLTGFVATFGIATIWQIGGDMTADFAVGQAFLIVSVLIYLATAVLYTRATPGPLGHVVDTTLLFGPALAGFGLQVGLVHDRPYGSAFAALGFAALYIGTAAFARARGRDKLRVMNEAMLAIGIGFVTIAVPLALGARWTSAAWALEGAGAFWVGARQARWMPRLFGLALQGVAGLLFLGSLRVNLSPLPLANPAFTGAVMIAVAALATAWWLRRPLPHSGSKPATAYAAFEADMAKPAFLIGFGFGWLALVLEATRLLPPARAGDPFLPVFTETTQLLLSMLAYVVAAFAAHLAARRLDWAVAGWPARASLIALAAGFFGQVGAGGHVLHIPAIVIWIIAIGLHLRMLHANDRAAGAKTPGWLTLCHVGGLWLATLMLADCLWLGIDRAALWGTSWPGLVFLTALILMLAALTAWAGGAMRGAGGAMRRGAGRWPLDRHATAYGWIGAAPIAVMLAADTLLAAMTASGQVDPLPYIPLLNPVEIAIALAIVTLALWRRTMLAADPRPDNVDVLAGPGPRAALAGLSFIAINTVWLRIAHHFVGVPWRSDALMGSVVVQTGLAILWTLMALSLMVFAHRRAQRLLWVVGATLLGVTVAKLLLVDLNAAGGAARIIAFIVVGLLMLVVGYLAPLPPRTPDDTPEGKAAA